MLHLVCYSNSLFQIKLRSGIDSAKDTLPRFIFTTNPLPLSGELNTELISTLWYCSTGTIVQFCRTQYHVNEAAV